jgi:hypothetical protein
MTTPRAASAATLGIAAVLVGCGDPPPDRSSAPVEIILPGCSLNRPSIAPGSHEFSVVGAGTVKVLDPAHEEVAAITGPTTTPEVVTIEFLGKHTINCIADSGDPTAATLDVTK